MLKDILTDIGIEDGETSSNVDRDARIFRVNKAAEEVHEQYDLDEGKDEKVFAFDVDDSPQIALPPWVFQVRGMRFHDGRTPITLDHMRNRYNFQWSGENELWYLKFRKIKDQCLSRDISNQSVLKLSIPLAETQAFTVTVTGRTNNSYRASEDVVFAVGDLVKETVGNYLEVEAISKNIITKYDVTVKDVEDNILGQVLNSDYQSPYKVYQIGDYEGFQIPESASAIEVWFKYKMQPFKNDNDTFFGTSRYDKAIFWKYQEHKSKKIDDALAFREKCGEAIAATIINSDAGARKQINFTPNPLLNVYDFYGPARRY